MEQADASDGAIIRQAAAAWQAGRTAAAEALAEYALAHAATAAGRVDAVTLLGAVAALRGDLNTAADRLDAAIAESRALAYSHGYALALQFKIMLVLLPRGRFAPALAAAAEAARIDAEHAVGQRGAAMARAWVARLVGDRAAAHEALAAMGGPAGAGPSLEHVRAYIAATLALDEERLDEAEALLGQAYSAADYLGAPQLVVGVRSALSRLGRARASYGAAREWAAEAVAAAERAGAPYLAGGAHLEAAWVALEAHDWPEAEGALARALALLEPLDAAYDLSGAALARAALLLGAGRPGAEEAWVAAAERMLHFDHIQLIDHERAVALPLALAHLHSERPQVRAAAEATLAALRERPPQPLAIVGLGAFAVFQGGRRLDEHALALRRSGELLRLLLVSPGHQAHREQIFAALWPDRGQAAAPLLHQASSALRRALEPHLPERLPSRYLQVDHEHIALRLPPGSSFDLFALERAIAARDHARLAGLLERVDLTLFPDDRHAQWVTAPRGRAADLVVRGLTALAAHHIGEPAAALAYADRARALDPWAEEAALVAMRACVAQGDRPGALRRFAAYRRALRRDLGLAPRADILALAESL